MKHLFKASVAAIIVTVAIIGFSSFNTKKVNTSNAVASYVISLENKESFGANHTWEWSLYNPNPGNGTNGTLQNLSHWDIPLSPEAEAALISAEYSTDGGITWVSVPLDVERDPAIRACTKVDVLKFNVGTVGSQPNYYRITFDTDFEVSPFATSYVKTGGGLQGCNAQFFAGVSGSKLF